MASPTKVSLEQLQAEEVYEAMLGQRFTGRFVDAASVMHEFDEKTFDLTNEEVIFAWYEYEDYKGSALIVFERDGELYEVNGSHCSCNGLEDQWFPEATSWAAIAMRPYFDMRVRERVGNLVLRFTGKRAVWDV